MPHLFLDLDDTLLHEFPAAASELLLQRRLMALLRDQAVVVANRDPAEAERQIRQVEAARTWWRWRDYLDPLGLDEASFWQAADQHMAALCRPLLNRPAQSLARLVSGGWSVWITSNNPSDGIAHKLRLAGIPPARQQALIAGFLGTDVVEGNKSQPAFWQRAVKIVGADPASVCVVGDNARDDMDVPHEAGLSGGILIGPVRTPLRKGWRSCQCVNEAVRILTAAVAAPSAAASSSAR